MKKKLQEMNVVNEKQKEQITQQEAFIEKFKKMRKSGNWEEDSKCVCAAVYISYLCIQFESGSGSVCGDSKCVCALMCIRNIYVCT